MFLEKFFQDLRFNMARPYLIGDVLDFGGNEGELRKFVVGKYIAVNYDHSVMENVHVDTIVSLAVIEHMNVKDTYEVFHRFKEILNKNGRIFLTTPSGISKPFLDFMAFLKIIDSQNIVEHKHYWNEREIYDLAEATGFVVKKYKKYPMVFNQLAVFEHK